MQLSSYLGLPLAFTLLLTACATAGPSAEPTNVPPAPGATGLPVTVTSAPADATVTPITPSRTAAPTNTPFLRFTATVPVPADTAIPATTLPVGTPSITITVTMNDMRFQPSELTVRSGETVHLELQNPDRLEHAFVIADANVAVVLSPMSEQEVDFVVNLPPGTYYIHCPILDEGGDHEVNGMTGKLIVEAAP